MTTRVTATVIGGMLKPDQVLSLAELTRVNLTAEPIEERLNPIAAWESIKARLLLRPVHGLGKQFNREELHERH